MLKAMKAESNTPGAPTRDLRGPSTAEERSHEHGSGGQAMIILIAHPDGQGLGTRMVLEPESELEIGRDPGCRLSFPTVHSLSRVHARLGFADGAVVVTDLKSTNGTFVNDRRVGQPFEMRSGDRLQCGALHFKFFREADVEAAYHLAIHDLVMQDGLTELANRRKFDDELAREFARARRHRRPLSLVLLDIDGFKKVNDDLGHLGGDSVLKGVASVCRSHVRPEELCARIGGDEFAILSPETDIAGSTVLAERLRFAIAENRFDSPMLPDSYRVSCSFGCAEFVSDMTSPADLLSAADRAMYAAKEGGRNRVERA
jgi:two-component system cell cycle response regulator